MPTLVVSITLFVLALLIGIEVIGKVPATLHTPLMSGANSIHGIVIVGVVIVAAEANSPLAYVFIFLAAVLGTMNVVGGYVVTDRMLEMFKSSKNEKKGVEVMTSATVGAIDIVAWFVYLFSAVLFVVGLHFMNSPKTARKGNQISAFGMVVAVLMAFIVLFAKGFVNIVAVVVLVVGILIGAVAGVVSAKKVKMTDMPQLVSVFNTVGGGAAALVALNDILTKEGTPDIVVLITAGLGILIGSVTFTGSLIAAGKLQGIKWVKKLNLPGKGVWNILFAVLSVASLVMLCVQPEQRLLWSILTTVFALCYGLVFVIPIGGADMPVVISVLNACTGTAVAMSGLAIDNVALIVAGALVGSAGVTLSILMAQAMNRPLLSVLAGGFGGGADAAAAGDGRKAP